jgi:prepilin-type N-terminal cleavage/methylation domain-containing protein
MKLTKFKKIYLFKKLKTSRKNGYSINEMVIVIAIIGILSSILVPSFRPAVEFIEVLMAEKYLLRAAQECKIGLINGELSPAYSKPENEISLGVFKENKFSFSYTGVGGECAPEYGGNELKVSRKNTNSGNIIYSLIINVVTAEKTSEGSLPNWLDWWDKESTNSIIDN